MEDTKKVVDPLSEIPEVKSDGLETMRQTLNSKGMSFENILANTIDK